MKELHRKLQLLNKNSKIILLNETGLLEQHRLALYMKYVDGMSYKEMSCVPPFDSYDPGVISGIALRARRELNSIIEEQYELLSGRVRKIIDIMYEIDPAGFNKPID